jgi:predicted type IV restriction endonuclease
MDPVVAMSFVTALGSLAGIIWVVYSGRKTLKATATISMFDQAMQLVDAKDEEIKRLNIKVMEQERRITILERRVAIQKARVRRLIESLSVVKRLPIDVIRINDLMVNDEDAEEGDDDDGK